MKNIHPTDIEIQRFLFDQLECEPQIIKHILSCEDCKRRAEIYESISSSIKNQPEPKLAYNLADVIFDQLPSSTNKVSPSFDYLTNFILLTISGITILAFLLFGEILTLLVNDSLPYQNYFIVSIVGFISCALVTNSFRTFNKKMNRLNS